MTHFGKMTDRGLKAIGREAVEAALKESSVDKSQIEAAIVGNATAGLITGQEMIKAQVILREMGFGDIPMINTENACASSSTAFHLAWLYVASGMYDCVLALGVEKLYHEDKRRSFQAIGSAVDVTAIQELMKATASRGREGADGGGAERRRRESPDVHGLDAAGRASTPEALRHDGNAVSQRRRRATTTRP
jgi:acetyl-CoA acetyltransferase